jgi:hypothetical protein
MARAPFINFLNGGDTWSDATALERVVPHLDGALIVTGHSITGGVVSPPFAVRSDQPLPRRAWLSHQASFVHRSVFDACGGFDTRFRLCMDYEFWLRALQRFDHVFIDELLVDFEAGGVSSSDPALLARELAVANRMHLRNAGLINVRTAARQRLHRALGRLGCFDAYRRWRLRHWQRARV